MSGRYRTICADPPWDYDGNANGRLWRSTSRVRGGHYPLMTLAAIKALPVNDLAEKDAHLYLWSTVSLMRSAYEVVEAWGFAPSTVITWCKPGPGMGAGWRGNTEHLIVARRGTLPFLTTGRGTWYVASRTQHSAKPECFIDMIEEMSPGPRLEMFARRHRFGWDVWGLESANTAQLGDAV